MPWNKNKAVGQKKPFSPKQVRMLKDFLENKNELRDLALFSLGIDTMLRASDLLKLTVSEIMDFQGNIKSQITLKQQKTKTSHTVMISDETAKYLKQYIEVYKLYDDDYVFPSLTKLSKSLNPRIYRDFVKKWCTIIGVDPKEYSTHSLRRTKASLIYRKTGNIEAVRILLGQKSVTSTSSYLNIDKQEALNIAKEFII